MSGEKKKVFIGVSDFAMPCPRRGSIDSYSGFGNSKEKGSELHRNYQEDQSEIHPDFKPEVQVMCEIEREEFLFQISGRMDGFFEQKIKIEEVKSTFNVYELLNRLKDDQEFHPYILQLRTYGYIYFLKTTKIPTLNLRLISSRNGDRVDLKINLDLDRYNLWLELRLDELVKEARSAEKRSQRRKTVSSKMEFPFENWRTGQTELIETIEASIKAQRPLMVQAPTGLGKTVGVIYPLLKESLSRGQQLIYVTPKNSQHSVAEDAIDRLQEKGAKIKSMTFTAKSKLCLKNEPICNPEYCEFADQHYTKITENNILETLSKKKNLTSKVFKKMGVDHEVCPFELQIDVAKEADAIICDYNYVFAPESALGRVAGIELEQIGKPNLAVDEAHNLISRSLDYYSPELSTGTLENMREDITRLPEKFRNKTLRLLNNCISVISNSGPLDARSSTLVDPPIAKFLEQDSELREHLSNYLKSDTEIMARDPVMGLCYYWSEFTDALQFVTGGRKEFFTTYNSNPARIKINCCDASEMLKSSYQRYSNVVSFSATLKPFQYYTQLSGLNDMNVKLSEFASPFPKENRKIVLIPQISSKFSDRERNYSKISEVIEKVSNLKKGNYFAFFPSFDFMGRVAKIFKAPPGFETIVQRPQLRRESVQEILDSLSVPGSANVVFGVQGGVLSEGMDYPGDMIIGAFIVGPPLPNFNLEREKMREYYQNHYEAGFEYAYAYPAMAKAVQAAGRVIRSETDRGIIVLMDNRFGQPSFSQSMPQDWFDEHPGELVSNSILGEISSFWAQDDNVPTLFP